MTEQLALGAQVIHERRSCCIKTKQFFQKNPEIAAVQLWWLERYILNFFLSILVYTKTVDCALIGYSNSEFPSPISHIQQHARDSCPKIL